MSSKSISLSEIYQNTLDYCTGIRQSDLIAEKQFIQNTNIVYFAYPLLFTPVFKDTDFDMDFIKELSVAGFLLYRSTIILDRLKDSDDKEKVQALGIENLISAAQTCKDEAFRILKGLFSEDSIFWKYVYEAKNEFKTEDAIEQKLKEDSPVSSKIDDLIHLSYVKAIFGRLAIDALYAKAIENEQEPDKYINLYFQYKNGVEIYKELAFGLQAIDDIDDFEKDFISGQSNMAIMLTRSVIGIDSMEVSQYKSAFYFSGIASVLYYQVEKSLQRIMARIDESHRVLYGLISQMQSIAFKKRFTIDNYIKTKTFASSYELSIYPSDIRNEVDKIIEAFKKKEKSQTMRKGLAGILQNSLDSFKEVYHFMYLPPNDGFVDDGVYVGNVFPLAILATFFNTLENSSEIDLSPITRPLKKYLLSLRQSNYHGTWCYLNDFKYLAPDIDDMAQIIRSLGKDTAKKECLEAIDFVSDRILEIKKPVTTWIPAIVETPEYERQKKLNNEKWGDTVDIEVVANLLLLYDSINEGSGKYDKTISILADYLTSQYRDCGSEIPAPRWYYSSIYPVYLLSRLKTIRLPEAILKNIISAIIDRQNTDGGWGNDYTKEKSDSLNTALAVSAIKNISRGHRTDAVDNAVTSGIRFIESRQAVDGLWEKVNFIKPRFEDPYSSRVITSAFCLEALI